MIAMKFLVIQQKMIGDVLTSTVICKGLKNAFPDCTVHFVANENTLAVLEHNPYIDKIIVFEKRYSSSKAAFFKFLKIIKQEVYHAVIDAYGKLESNLISLFSRSKNKIAHNKWYTRWIYTNTIKENLQPNGKVPLAIQNRLNLLKPILKEQREIVAYPEIFLTDNEIKKAEKEADSLKKYEGQKLIMVGILGSSPIKTYPSQYMAALLDLICSHSDVKLLFNYIPSQKSEAIAIYEKCLPSTQKQIAIDFYADSLRSFLGILSACTALIGNEGGAVNMAKALGIPTFCMFSPFIIKGAWHSDSSPIDSGIHLKDYKPELFENLDKKGIKKNIDELYSAFEPDLFKDEVLHFLDKNIARSGTSN